MLLAASRSPLPMLTAAGTLTLCVDLASKLRLALLHYGAQCDNTAWPLADFMHISTDRMRSPVKNQACSPFLRGCRAVHSGHSLGTKFKSRRWPSPEGCEICLVFDTPSPQGALSSSSAVLANHCVMCIMSAKHHFCSLWYGPPGDQNPRAKQGGNGYYFFL